MALDPRSCMYRCDQPERCGALVPPLKDRASSARHFRHLHALLCAAPRSHGRRVGGGGHMGFLRPFSGFFNVDTGSAEIVQTYESDRTSAQCVTSHPHTPAAPSFHIDRGQCRHHSAQHSRALHPLRRGARICVRAHATCCMLPPSSPPPALSDSHKAAQDQVGWCAQIISLSADAGNA
jgi:hypothetical protein